MLEDVVHDALLHPLHDFQRDLQVPTRQTPISPRLQRGIRLRRVDLALREREKKANRRGRGEHVPHGHPNTHLLGDGLMDRLRHLLLHRRFLPSTPHSLLQSALQLLQRVHAHDPDARQRDSQLLQPAEVAWDRLGELL